MTALASNSAAVPPVEGLAPLPLRAAPMALTPTDLAELLASFNEVTARLQATHDQLRSEVSRLSGELRDANEQIERSRRLAALGEMAAGIAHEVRNPLGSIRLYARMLEEDLAAQPAQASLAGKISGATRVVEGIVGDVLSFAREFKLRLQSVPARDVVEKSLECCRHDGVSGWRGVDVVGLESGGLGSVTVRCDPALLQQALVNVIRNAFEAMAEEPEGPRMLELSTATRRVARAGERQASARRAQVVVLRVRDTGPGVSPDTVARMFNPFFTTRGQGTGLGLAIVHRIIDAHGGSISVRNNSECDDAPKGFARGACIEIILPAHGAPGIRVAEADPERGAVRVVRPSPSETPGVTEEAGAETQA